ncbi:MAG: hypothetical protein AABZ55_05915 [Bdellovibrionota bacterium]
MSYLKRFFQIAIISGALLLSFDIWANSQLDVTLFGQPCLLQGPLDKSKLQAIHSISPEQALPAYENRLSSESTRVALLKVKKIAGLPAAVDLYKEKLVRRLEGQVAFLEALDSSRSAKNLTPIISIIEKLLSPDKRKEVEAKIKKLDPSRLFSNDLIEPIFQAFSDAIEPDPEDLFHRGIKKIGVQYICSFEAEGETDEPDDGNQKTRPAQPAQSSKPAPKKKD